MKLSQFLWKNYKESSSGKEMYAFFKNYNTLLMKNNEINFYQQLRLSIAYAGALKIDFYDHIKDISNVFFDFTHDEKNNPVQTDIQSIEDAESFFLEIADMKFLEEDGSLTEEVFSSDDVPFLSEVLYAIAPKYYFPYYFTILYQDVVEIFNTFGIFLPAVPKKNDKHGRFFHYFELCQSLYQFRIDHNLDEYDLPAFLYGFAINIIKRYDISEELPKPRNAYFVGAGKKDGTVDASGDFNYLDTASTHSISFWNGNIETQIGDIIVMYCLHPRSYVHSIWRAVTPGSVDPFFHFYKNLYIGKPIFVQNITLAEIKNDSFLSEFSLVKANMQGINGRNIPKKYYDRLLQILEDKGQDISILPKLEDQLIEAKEVKNERDVEIMLLEPLLLSLGYKQTDWVRQMKLRMGRSDKVYPDYVIHPYTERNNESCYWVWEAKYTIHSHKQLQEDFGQAKSYALRLQSSGLGLVSKEGVWLSTPDYDIKKIKFWSWKQLEEHENVNEIFGIAGKKDKK